MKRTFLATALLLAAASASAAGWSPLDRSVVGGRYMNASAPIVVAANSALDVRATGNWVPTQGRPRRERGVGAILYSNPGLRGDRYVIEGDYMRNLADTGFNDRAQSLHVDRGYWIFCSDADFQGTCRTFGPGDYPNLSRGLDNKISSGRRISNEYPYKGRPNWNR
ncbi:MAG TPA: beta/gamma crystallin-related protein [Casimicrobiaceae bacterium]|nr:beta/gamma crystallin-related protein [Casimicrobiaceae bacterium]